MPSHFRRFNRELLTTALSACLNFCRFTVDSDGTVVDDELYQAKSNSIQSITLESPGVYELQFNSPYPAAIAFFQAVVHRANTEDRACLMEMVPGSYSNTAGTLTMRAVVELTDGVAATGTVTLVTNANMTDGDYITIDDGYNTPVLYEYDKSDNGVTAGRVSVEVGGATTAAQVAAQFAAAITANQPLLNVIDNADGTLTINHTVVGTVGNNAMTENATHAGVLVSGLASGVNPTGAVAELPADAEVHLFIVELRLESMDVPND